MWRTLLNLLLELHHLWLATQIMIGFPAPAPKLRNVTASCSVTCHAPTIPEAHYEPRHHNHAHGADQHICAAMHCATRHPTCEDTKPQQTLNVKHKHTQINPLTHTNLATQTTQPPPNTRTRTWAQVAAGVPLSAPVSKRKRDLLQSPRQEEVQVVEELSSVLLDEKGESDQFEDLLRRSFM